MPTFSNIGNSCYINSALQLVFHSERIRLELQRPLEEKTEFLKELYELQSTDAVASPESIKRYISSRYEEFNNCYEQDAHEFLSFLLEEIEQNFESINQKFTVLEFTEQQSLTCSCGYHYETKQLNTEFLLDITVIKEVEIKSRFFSAPALKNALLQTRIRVLGSNLNELIKEELKTQLCQRKCQKCKTNLCSTLSFKSLPQELLIVIKRFTACGQKINAKIHYSEYLDFEKICSKKGFYKLNAVIMHVGTLDTGHYTCCSKNGNNWYEYSDEKMFEVTMNFDDSRAYILSYQLI